MEFDRDHAKYKAFFCEENIWHLANDLTRQKLSSDSFVLFLFNRHDFLIAVQNQRAIEDDAIGCWDYHVILLDLGNGRVFDLDTRLDCPTSIDEYFAGTFPIQQSLPTEFRTTVRLVPVVEYIHHFSSDRRHMLDAQGEPLKEFPSWDAIIAEKPIWLSQYLTVSAVRGSKSRVTDLDPFVASLRDYL